jgi:hypothetical protein
MTNFVSRLRILGRSTNYSSLSASGPMFLKSLSGAGLRRFNKNFRKLGIEASFLLNLSGDKREKTQDTGGD